MIYHYPKFIQLDFKLFVNLLNYFIDHKNENSETASFYDALSGKFKNTLKHQLFTIYKTFPDPTKRNEAFRLYLKTIGVHDSDILNE